jgi:hypothetical protein
MVEFTRITSEALQATVRRVLPSQAGFGDDLQATNLIQPVIDLTPTAEGSQLPTYLQQALDITSNFTSAVNQTKVVTSTPGFYLLRLNVVEQGSGGDTSVLLNIVEGVTVTTVFQTRLIPGAGPVVVPDFTVYLNSGQELQLVSNAGNAFAFLTARQVADLYGNLRNPTGFTFE